jgi:SAM-dependent methyltransferase
LDGIEPVTEERWRQAQQWEQAFWDRQNLPSVWWKRILRPLAVLAGLRAPKTARELDDRNYWWRAQFDNYSLLPRELDNACELGCGPYTNMRLIWEGRAIRHIHCSDPLATRYITYPRAWLAQAHRCGLVSVDSHAAEECPYRSDYFDLTVLVNVLDHVRDPLRCLSEALRITAPGGYFVFGQDLTGEGDRHPSNVGHPFVLSHQQLEPILAEACAKSLQRIVPRMEVSEPELHYGALVYIGRKRAQSACQ